MACKNCNCADCANPAPKQHKRFPAFVNENGILCYAIEGGFVQTGIIVSSRAQKDLTHVNPPKEVWP